MIAIESVNYPDVSGDDIQIDTHENFIEICVYHHSGCWPCDNPGTLRNVANQLLRAADKFESKTE